MGCKEICYKFKVMKGANGGIYEEGMKRCTFCNVNMIFHDLRCPCCNLLLRTKSRIGKLKVSMRI